MFDVCAGTQLALGEVTTGLRATEVAALLL